MNIGKIFGMALLLAVLSSNAFAGLVPEIDPGSAGGAIALLGGAALIIRSRRRK